MARLIVAEDQQHIRRVLAMWLTRHGYSVSEAASGTAALKLLESAPFDLLVTDVNMPEMDGIELTRRAFTACPPLRGVLVVTSRCDQRDILDNFGDPRIRVFPKPFSPSQLVREVAQIVGVPQGTTVASVEPQGAQ